MYFILPPCASRASPTLPTLVSKGRLHMDIAHYRWNESAYQSPKVEHLLLENHKRLLRSWKQNSKSTVVVCFRKALSLK